MEPLRAVDALNRGVEALKWSRGGSADQWSDNRHNFTEDPDPDQH
jgi:hypothetical protein